MVDTASASVSAFRIKSAQEVFQKTISQQFSDLEGIETEGVETEIDVIIVHAETCVISICAQS